MEEKITYQPPPRIPPIGFFRPITEDWEKNITDVEYLLGILKKLNAMVKTINSHSEFINTYSGKIEEIEKTIAELRQEMTTFEGEITASIETQFTAIKNELQLLVNQAVVQANAYTDVQARRLEQMIRDIALGQITVYDPTTGLLTDLQTVIDNLFGSSRENALTASEYDSLALDASVYDGYQIEAYEYDLNGKTILMS